MGRVGNDWKWNDVSCSNRLPAVCKKPGVKNQNNIENIHN